MRITVKFDGIARAFPQKVTLDKAMNPKYSQSFIQMRWMG